MAENTIVARPYAKAIFELAREGGAFEEWGNMLALACTTLEDDAFLNYMHSPDAEQEHLVDIILSASDILGGRTDPFAAWIEGEGAGGGAAAALDAALEDPDWFVHASHQLAMNATQSQNHDLALSVLRRLREERTDDPDADIPARLL